MTTAVLQYLRVQKGTQSKIGDAAFSKINPVRKIFLFSNGVNWKLVCFIAFFMCLSLLVYYVWQAVYLTSGSYSIESYRKQTTQLLDEKKDLEISFAENSFLEQAQKKIRELNFQKTTAVRYIQLPDNYLARAK